MYRSWRNSLFVQHAKEVGRVGSTREVMRMVMVAREALGTVSIAPQRPTANAGAWAPGRWVERAGEAERAAVAEVAR